MCATGFEVNLIEKRNRFLRRAFFVCLFLSGAVIAGYLAHTKPAKIVAALARINPVFFLLAVLTVIASWVVEGIRVFLIADALDERISIWHLIRINMATAFSGNVVPMASMAAPPTQVFLLHREGIPVGKATAIVAIRTAASTLFFTISAPILFLGFGPSLVRGITKNPAISAMIQLVLIVSSVVALTTLCILFRPELGVKLTNGALSLRFIQKLLGSRSDQIRDRVAKESQAFHESMATLFSRRRDAILVACLTLLYWGLYFSLAPLLLLGAGVTMSFYGIVKLVVSLFFAYFIVSYLPIPSGSGVSEIGFGSILALLGLPDPTVRTVILLVWSFLGVQIYTLLGGAFFLGSLRKRKKSETASGEKPDRH